MTQMPEEFRAWEEANADRLERAREKGTLPWFYRENRSVIDGMPAASAAPAAKAEAAKAKAEAAASTENGGSDEKKSPLTPQKDGNPTEKGVSDAGKADRERIEANRREYERLLADPDYTDVEFNPETGGLKATHKQHNFDEKKGWYEKHMQATAYFNGHSVILEKEIHTVRYKKNVEGLFDGLPFEIAGSETGVPNNIRNALKHCASKPNCKIAVVFFPNKDLVDMTMIREGLKKYFGLRNDSKQFKNFDDIYMMTSERIVYHQKKQGG